MPIEIITTLIGLLFTLCVFSYLIGDNPLFRFAVYLFIGVSSGYAAAVVFNSVLVPRFNLLLQLDVLTIIPILLSFTLLAKFWPRLSWVGNFAMAVLVGVGAAVAVGGAVVGTLLPQSQATINAFGPSAANPNSTVMGRLFEGGILLVGTVFTLASFQFSAGRAPDGTVKRNAIFEGIAWVGRIFVAIILGVLFAGVYMAALTAMIERLSTFINSIRLFLGL